MAGEDDLQRVWVYRDAKDEVVSATGISIIGLFNIGILSRQSLVWTKGYGFDEWKPLEETELLL